MILQLSDWLTLVMYFEYSSKELELIGTKRHCPLPSQLYATASAAGQAAQAEVATEPAQLLSHESGEWHVLNCYEPVDRAVATVISNHQVH